MTRSLGIEVSIGPMERVESDIVVARVFEDDRPLCDAAGRADWRLCGKLSKLISDGKFRGAAGEAVLITPRGAIQAKVLMVLGTGRRAGFRAEHLEAAANSAASRSLLLHARNVALPLPSSEATGIPLRSRVDSIVRGFVKAVRDRETDLHLHLIARAIEAAPVAGMLRSKQQAASATGAVVRVLDSEATVSPGPPLRPRSSGTPGGPRLSPRTSTQVIK